MIQSVRQTALRQVRTQLRRNGAVTVAHRSAIARLLSTLAVLEQRDGKLNMSSLAAVTAGGKLGGPVTAFVAGSGTKQVAEEAAKVKGIDKVVYVDSGAYDRVRLGIDRTHYGLLTGRTGVARELCASARREHQEGRLHSHSRRPLGVWQESYAAGRRPAGLAAGLRHNQD